MFKLVNNETGEESEHVSMYAASQSLGRHSSYIGQTIRGGFAIRDTKGFEYTIYKDGEIYDYERVKARKATHPCSQLCWSCKKAVCGCSWSRSFKPVNGWDAVPSTILNWSDGKRTITTGSYTIRGCPEYEPDKRGDKYGRD